jgi:hypothetical protein
VFAAFLDVLARPPLQVVVVVVEDAHWADDATLDLLVFLGRRLERTPAMLVVTYRDDELGADHPLRGVLGALPQGVVRRVRPQPLSEAAVAELARRAGHPAAGLRALTGGNPLLVTEVLAAGDADVPMTVRDLVPLCRPGAGRRPGPPAPVRPRRPLQPPRRVPPHRRRPPQASPGLPGGGRRRRAG